eukprot:g4815.t1
MISPSSSHMSVNTLGRLMGNSPSNSTEDLTQLNRLLLDLTRLKATLEQSGTELVDPLQPTLAGMTPTTGTVMNNSTFLNYGANSNNNGRQYTTDMYQTGASTPEELCFTHHQTLVSPSSGNSKLARGAGANSLNDDQSCSSPERVSSPEPTGMAAAVAAASIQPPTLNEKCPCPAAKYHLEILRKRTAQSYEWHGTGRVPLFYANLDRSRGRRVRMDYVLGKTAIRVPGLDQRNVQAWMKHNIFTPDEYLHKYFRSLVPRRPGEFGATLSHLKQVWAAYAWFVKKSFPAMRDKLREEVERLKGHGARASPSSASMPSSSGTELAASGAGGMGEGIKGSTNSLRGAGTPSEDDYEGGRAAPQVGPATATSSEGALLSTTARPVVGVNSLHSEAEHDVAAQAQVGGGAAQPRNDEHGDMADPSGEGESSAPPGMIGSDVDAPGEDGGPQGQGGAAGHHDDGGGNNRRRLEAADRGSAAAFSGGATRKSTSGSIRRTAHVEKGGAATALSPYDYETSAPGPAVTEISEKPASTPRRGLRSSLTASTRSGASEPAPKNWWFEEPNYRDAEGELVDWTLRMEDDTFFGHLSEADRKFSAMFFEDDTSTASRDIGWGGVTVTDFADALDAYDAKWETLRLGTNNCDEPWRVDIGSKRPFSESVFANDRLECFGATSYMVSLRGMRVLLRKYLVSQRAVAIVGEDVMRKKKLLVEQGPGAVNAGWGEELIVLRVTDDSCKQFWCRGNQYCLQELQREYSKPVKRLCDEKIESLKQEAAAYRVQLETDAVLLQSDPAKKQALQNRLERAENARRWNVDRCAGVMREKVAAFHGCVEKIIPPDPLHVDYRVEARFDVPKFNLTSFRGIYPVADVLIFQEALNAKTAYRLLHNYIFESIFEIEPVLSHGHIPTALDDEFAKAGMVSTLKAREKVLNWMVDVVEESPASWTTTPSGGAAGGAGGGTSATPTASSSMLTLPSSAATNKEEFHDEHTHQEWHWLLKRGAQRADWVGEEPCVYFLNLDRSRRRRKRMRLLLGEKGRRVRALDHYDAERWKRMSQPDTPEELATIKPTRHNRIGEHALTLSHLLAVYQGFADYVKAWGATRATGQGAPPPSPDNEGNHILQESRQHQRLSGQELEYLKQKYFPKILHAAEDDPTMDDLHVLLEDYAANAAEDEKGNRHDDVLSAAAGASKEAARVAKKPSPRGRRLQQQSAAFNGAPLSTPRAANLASSPQLQFHEQILEHLALPEPQFLAKAAEKNLQNYAMTLVEDDISTGSHDIGWGRVTLTDLRDAIRRYDDKWETLRLGTSNCDPPGGSWNASFVLFVPDANVRNCYGAVAYMTSLLGMRRLLKKYLVDVHVEGGGGKKNGEVAAAKAHVVDQQHSLFSPKFDVTRFEGAYPVADLLMFSNPHAWRVQTAFLFESVFEPDPVLRHGHVKRDREEALVIDGIMNSYRAREQGIDIRLNVWT